MQDKYERWVVRLSAVVLLAAGLLIPLGFLGIGASPFLVVAFLGFAALLYAGWQRAEGDFRAYLAGLWLGPAVAAAVVVYGLSIAASPGELQALGGITGVVGVVNLLLRPVYRLVHYAVTGALRAGRAVGEDRS